MPDGGRSAIIREENRQPITSIAFSSDGRWLLTGTNHGFIQIRSLDQLDGPPILSRQISSEPVYAISCSPDRRRIIAGCRGGQSLLVDFESGEIIAALDGHDGPIRSAIFSVEGSVVVTAGQDGKIGLWRTTDGNPLLMLRAHNCPIHQIAISHHGQMIASASEDGCVKLWKIV